MKGFLLLLNVCLSNGVLIKKHQTMTHDNLIKKITSLLEVYVDNVESFDHNPQLRINPANFDLTIVNGSDMLKEIEDSNEAIEDAASADGAETEESADYQVKQNPDFYPAKKLVKETNDGKFIPDKKAITDYVSNYLS